MLNWGGNVDFGGAEIVHPTQFDELAAMMAAAPRCRALGSRHSFNDISTAATVIDTSALPKTFSIADDRSTVAVTGSATYGWLIEQLIPHELALKNTASLPHISIAGAVATGTHGSGDQNQNLAASVSRVRILRGDGESIELDRGDPDFAGAVVGLGALGIVTEVVLDVVPTFDVEQRVFDGPDLATLATLVDTVFAAGYSVSVFTHWQGGVEQIWVKHRVGDVVPDASEALLDSLAPAQVRQHPILGLDASGCTEQFGIRGRWCDRLPHFQMGFTPSAGNEIQSEFFVDRRHAAEAIEAMTSIGSDIADALMVGEIRTVAGDDMWMSPHTGRDSLAFHFTWHPDQELAEAAANSVADALDSFAVRPHWGKVFDPERLDLNQYERRHDFLDLVTRMDPAGKFRNAWFDTVL